MMRRGRNVYGGLFLGTEASQRGSKGWPQVHAVAGWPEIRREHHELKYFLALSYVSRPGLNWLRHSEHRPWVGKSVEDRVTKRRTRQGCAAMGVRWDDARTLGCTHAHFTSFPSPISPNPWSDP
eukprot:357627-Chlamydomonas_euryale.AAC.8